MSSQQDNPAFFIDKLAPRNADQTQVFGRSVLPYIYNAFRQWRGFVYKNGNPEVRNEVIPQDLNWSKGIDVWAREFIALTYHPNEINLHSFPANTQGCNLPSTKEEAFSVMRLWHKMMLREIGWNPNINNQPFIIDLSSEDPLIVALLPKTMTLGNYKLIRIMDAFYAPDKQGAKWAEQFFDLIADKYERIVDLKLKASIDLLLLAYTSGYVFDVGCGTGLAQNWINQFYAEDAGLFRLFGIDISSKMLEIATMRGEKTIKGNIAELTPQQIRRGFRKIDRSVNFFDHAIMSYFDNWTTKEERIKIFRNIHNLLKTGGSLRLNVYNISDPNWFEYYQTILSQVGFKKVESTEMRLPARDGSRDVGFVFAYK